MRSRVLLTAATVTTAVFVTSGIAYAASIDAASKIGGQTGDFFSFQGSTVEVGSLKVGSQGSGGVTFFNGTIVNNTTSDGNDNPVTISDNLRVDGGIQRGHNLPNDQWGVKILDDMTVFGELVVNEDTRLLQDVAVSGNQTIANELSVGTSLNVTNDANVGGSQTVGNDLAVNGDAGISGRLSAGGDISFVGTRYKMYGGEKAVPISSAADNHVLTNSGVLEIQTANTNSETFIIPLDLPDGASLTSAAMYAVDNDGTGVAQSIDADIVYADITGPFFFENTLGNLASPLITGANLGDHLVNNSTNHYYARVTITNTGIDDTLAAFVGLRIEYVAKKPN